MYYKPGDIIFTLLLDTYILKIEHLLLAERYKCWWRHSGMDSIYKRELSFTPTQLYTNEEIKKLCSGHVITDLKIEGDLPAAVTEFAPLVTTLCIRYLTSINSLE